MGNRLDGAQQSTPRSTTSPGSGHTSCPAPQDWIEVQLLGPDGNPMGSAKYEITVPREDEARTGALDGQGKVKVERIHAGDCQVVFPELEVGTCPDWLGIELVDDKGQAVPEADYEVVLANGETKTGKLDAKGKALLSDVFPGPCRVTFPKLKHHWRLKRVDRDEEDRARGMERMSVPPEDHTLVEGDCAASVAAAKGFFRWESVWGHYSNATLRQELKNPFTLTPGKVLKVPPHRRHDRKTKTLHDEQPHVFRHCPMTTLLRFTMEMDDKPIAHCQYELVVGSDTLTGNTDETGLIAERVDPTETTGTLKVWIGDETVVEPTQWTLGIGKLPSIQTKEGLVARLANLGEIKPDAGDSAALAALNKLLEAEGLPEESALDGVGRRTRLFLEDRYGCWEFD